MSQVIEALKECHKQNPIAKFWGVCNEQKWALDRCLREEKKIKIQQNKLKKLQREEKKRERLLKRTGGNSDN